MNTVNDLTEVERGFGRGQFITIGDLEKFKLELLKEIAELLQSTSNQSNKKWLKSSEIRKLLHISPGTLQTLRVNGKLPFTKVGGTLYYRAEDVDHMMMKGDSNQRASEKEK